VHAFSQEFIARESLYDREPIGELQRRGGRRRRQAEVLEPPRADQRRQRCLERGSRRRKAVRQQVAIEHRVPFGHERRAALVQPQEHHFHARRRGEVVALEAMHDACVEPRLDECAEQAGSWLAEHARRGFRLNRQVAV